MSYSVISVHEFQRFSYVIFRVNTWVRKYCRFLFLFVVVVVVNTFMQSQFKY